MIVTQIIGGLGNQMFQYAAARALSLLRQDTLFLDCSAFDSYELHQGFELKRIFPISALEMLNTELQTNFGWKVTPLALRLAARWRHFPFADEKIVLEPSFDYWPGLASVPKNAYLRGYWQSEQYFSRFSDIIRKDFCFSSSVKGNVAYWAGRISQDNAVSLHVRRGDYVANPSTLAVHGVCSLEYYMRAVKYIAPKVANPVFYVFSDDIPWVRAHLNIDFPMHFVEGNTGASSYRDLQLMSLCKHNVIANSSFSWWGAWLNANPGKIVVAPERWFAVRPKPKDLYPMPWITL